MAYSDSNSSGDEMAALDRAETGARAPSDGDGAPDAQEDQAPAPPAENAPASGSGAGSAKGSVAEGRATREQKLLETAQAALDECSTMLHQICKLANDTEKRVKDLHRVMLRHKRRRVGAIGRETNLTKPMVVSDKLCSFLGVDAGTHMARPEITRRISDYANRNHLKLQSDRRRLTLDTELQRLFDQPPQTEVRLCDIQRLIKPHLEAIP